VRTLYDPLLVNEVVPVKFMEVTDTCEVEVEEVPETLAH